MFGFSVAIRSNVAVLGNPPGASAISYYTWLKVVASSGC